MMRPTCWAASQAKAGAARKSLPECQNCISSLTRHILTECLLSVGGRQQGVVVIGGVSSDQDSNPGPTLPL